jgi:hypothetical protein
LLRRVEPEYPAIAIAAHVEGMVILEALVDADGRVQDVTGGHASVPLCLPFAGFQLRTRVTGRQGRTDSPSLLARLRWTDEESCPGGMRPHRAPACHPPRERTDPNRAHVVTCRALADGTHRAGDIADDEGQP